MLNSRLPHIKRCVVLSVELIKAIRQLRAGDLLSSLVVEVSAISVSSYLVALEDYTILVRSLDNNSITVVSCPSCAIASKSLRVRYIPDGGGRSNMAMRFSHEKKLGSTNKGGHVGPFEALPPHQL
jgi:hypothetical protein